MARPTLLCIAALVAAVSVSGCASAPSVAPGDAAAGGTESSRSSTDSAAAAVESGKSHELERAHEVARHRARTALSNGPGATTDSSEQAALSERQPARREIEPLVVRVTDSSSDREGADQTPDYIEITAATVSAARGRLALEVEVAEPVARQVSSDEVAIFAFDVDTTATSWSAIAQLTADGVSGELRSEEAAHEIDVRMRGNSITLAFPWRLIGAQEPFSWTASTAHLTFEAQAATANGGDAAPAEPTSFPS
jgi:hypothetical protein